jgi:hypothetical protein
MGQGTCPFAYSEVGTGFPFCPLVPHFTVLPRVDALSEVGLPDQSRSAAQRRNGFWSRRTGGKPPAPSGKDLTPYRS